MLLVASADFFQKFTFSKNYFRNSIIVSNRLDPDQDGHSDTKFEVAMSNCLEEISLQEKTLFDLCFWGQGHTECCPVPSTPCDLFRNNI